MTKKILPYLLTAFMSMFGLNAYAYDIAVKNADGVTIYYNWSNDKTELAVCNKNWDYGDYSGNVVIPEYVEYGGKTFSVTSIDRYGFAYSELTSVTIPSSVRHIDEDAFYGCGGLTSVNISDISAWCKVSYSMNEHISNPFYYADHLFLNGKEVKDLIIPNNVTSINSYAFFGCNGLTSVTIPNSVTSVGSYAFYGCNGLTSVTISNSVISVGSNAFSGCNGLISIKVDSDNKKYDSRSSCNAIIETSTNTLIAGCKKTVIPNSVTSVGGYAFYNCSGLTSVTIPNSVTSIGYDAFYGTAWYNNQVDGLVYAGRIAYKYKGEMPANTHITIKDGTLGITQGAFSGCSGLTSINIPNSVTSIGSSAFSGCSGLTSVAIPNSVESIGDRAFLGCSVLTTVIIPNSVTSIGSSAFQGCRGLTSVTIPNSVNSIGDNAFSGCSGFTSIIVENGNAQYDSRNNCSAIIETSSNTLIVGCKNTIIPNGVTSIGSSAFFSCSGLTSITIPNGLTSIGNSAFQSCSGLTSVTIPNSVTSIGNSAFQSCSGLTSVTIPNSMTSIGNSVFDGCSGLTSVTIPNSVESIGDWAFSGCNGLTTVIIPNSVLDVGDFAFYGCSGLISLTIPNSVTSIGDCAFYGTAWYDNQPDGLVYAGKMVYKYKGEIPTNTHIIIKDGTLGIADNAFYYRNGLTSVTIPNSVTSIGSSAFAGCSGLTSVTIPNSVTSIGFAAFLSCSGLTSVTIPNSVTSISSYTFNGCIGLTSIIIPNSVESICYFAFSGCSSLTSVAIPNSVTSIGWGAFNDTGWYNNQPEGLVYAGSVAYKYKGRMPDNTKIILKDGTQGIADNAFSGCFGLTSVIFPQSVTSIGSYAFGSCGGLTTITLEIEKPFEIDSGTFSDDTYNVAELIVPYGTRGAYQDTEGWNKFTMITEAPDKDAVAFTINGISYEGSKSEKTVVVKAVDTTQTSIEIPASVSYDGITFQVSGITDSVFDGSSMAAMIWDVEASLPNNAFSNASIGSNFLLYVKSSSYAPSSVKNVVVDGTAQTIVLSDDGGQFYCPQAFTARRISYSHNYSMETGKGSTMGWESIALPFDVQRIIHSTQGEIVPFAAYSSGSNQKPFWLAYMSAGGFKRTADIRANEAYIIAMPNNSSYSDNYILAGDVTFSAENTTVPKTPSFNGTFLPAFSFVAKSSSVYALNVNNRYVRYSGSEKPGSVFIRDLRDVRPFEAYLIGNFTRGIIEINYDSGTTDILDVLLSTDDYQEMTIHTLSGQQVARTTQRDFNTVWQQLPKGVYIVKGKKLIK